jgi:hypothetical protein
VHTIEGQFYVTKRAAIREIVTDAQIWYDCRNVDFRDLLTYLSLPKSANVNLDLVHERQQSSKECRYDATKLHVFSLLANVT